MRALERRLRIGGLAAIAGLAVLMGGAAPAAADAPPAGPPYPAPVAGQRVYDYAGIFSPQAIAEAEQSILDIENRSGAQVVVYTQVKPESDTLEAADQDAADLIDQWGIGRKGFDDGLVIMFDMQDNLRHGEVSLYAGSGYRAAFLSDEERQSIFDNDMAPLLRAGDFDSALAITMEDIGAAATPEHAAKLESARQLNALIAVGGLGLGALLCLIAGFAWFRHGRDPVYLDDPSVLMSAPPADLTPAMATLLIDDRTTDRTVYSGLVDLAAKGAIAFQQEDDETGVRYLGAGSKEFSRPEEELLEAIGGKATRFNDGYIPPEKVYRLGGAFSDLKGHLEDLAVKRGWLTGRPSDVISTWETIGGIEIVLAAIAGFLWLSIGASGLFTLALGLLGAGIFTIVFAKSMPARTRQGAMLYAMLAAYRRTLRLTMERARSMGEVVESRALNWITTPDEAMAWGVALGLNSEIEAVMRRSTEAPAAEPTSSWHPMWMIAGSSSGGWSGGSHGGHASSAGLYSATPLPDPGSIFAALSSVTHATDPTVHSSSSGGSSFSSGSFGGGGSSGGGGAGGGF
jgi:uncharacterized membrane protein YgcG